MTASTVKATAISNITVGSVTQRELAKKQSGRVHSFAASITAATTSLDEIGDKIMMFRVPKNFVPNSLILRNNDLDSNGTPALAVDIGLYTEDVAAGTFTAKDADFFASAVTTLQAANLTGVDHVTESGVVTLDKLGQQSLYEILADTGGDAGYYVVGIAVTTAAATAAQGIIHLELKGCLG